MKMILRAVFLIVLFPSLAFGQTINECRDRQKLTEMAMEVRDRVSSGESEDSLLMWAGGIEAPGLQAAAYKAIEAYTFQYAPGSLSQVVTVMGYMCSKTYRP
ncbi:hypothetical protein [Halomonas sp. BMC6]|uniref:hypothetical protein n=1 Tax=Halomonas sp. BMC6 TaxID=3073244 RepID=UPI0030D0218A